MDWAVTYGVVDRPIAAKKAAASGPNEVTDVRGYRRPVEVDAWTGTGNSDVCRCWNGSSRSERKSTRTLIAAWTDRDDREGRVSGRLGDGRSKRDQAWSGVRFTGSTVRRPSGFQHVSPADHTGVGGLSPSGPIPRFWQSRMVYDARGAEVSSDDQRSPNAL